MKAPNEELCKAGVQTEAGVTDAKWVSEKGVVVASDSGKKQIHGTPDPGASLEVNVKQFFCLTGSCAGALELWELAEDERLLVNRFTKHDHDHIVTSVSPVTGANSAVTGSMDCRLDSVSL